MPSATGSSRYREKRHKQWLSRKENKGGTFHEFACMSSLCRGHANLLCIVPGLVYVGCRIEHKNRCIHTASCTTCTLSRCSPLHKLCQEVICMSILHEALTFLLIASLFCMSISSIAFSCVSCGYCLTWIPRGSQLTLCLLSYGQSNSCAHYSLLIYTLPVKD